MRATLSITESVHERNIQGGKRTELFLNLLEKSRQQTWLVKENGTKQIMVFLGWKITLAAASNKKK